MANGTLKVSNIQTSSGSGTITVGQSGETISVPSGATLDMSSATTTLSSSMKNTPMFVVAMSGNQSLGAGSTTKIQFDTEVFDTAGNYDPTTNYRFTPTTAGKYLVQASLYYNIAAFDKRLQTSVRKNGSAHILSTVSSGKNNSANVAYMNEYAASDYLELFGYQDQSSGGITMGAEAPMTWICITKIIE